MWAMSLILGTKYWFSTIELVNYYLILCELIDTSLMFAIKNFIPSTTMKHIMSNVFSQIFVPMLEPYFIFIVYECMLFVIKRQRGEGDFFDVRL